MSRSSSYSSFSEITDISGSSIESRHFDDFHDMSDVTDDSVTVGDTQESDSILYNVYCGSVYLSRIINIVQRCFQRELDDLFLTLDCNLSLLTSTNTCTNSLEFLEASISLNGQLTRVKLLLELLCSLCDTYYNIVDALMD